MACSRRRRPSRGTKLGRISRSGGVWQQLQHYAQFPDFNNYLVFLLARVEEKDKLVPFLEREDAAAAKDNMDGAELLGRVLTVNYAVPKRIKGGEQGWAAQPRVDRCEIFPKLSWESTYKLCYPSSVHCSS